MSRPREDAGTLRSQHQPDGVQPRRGGRSSWPLRAARPSARCRWTVVEVPDRSELLTVMLPAPLLEQFKVRPDQRLLVEDLLHKVEPDEATVPVCRGRVWKVSCRLEQLGKITHRLNCRREISVRIAQ